MKVRKEFYTVDFKKHIIFLTIIRERIHHPILIYDVNIFAAAQHIGDVRI